MSPRHSTRLETLYLKKRRHFTNTSSRLNSIDSFQQQREFPRSQSNKHCRSPVLLKFSVWMGAWAITIAKQSALFAMEHRRALQEQAKALRLALSSIRLGSWSINDGYFLGCNLLKLCTTDGSTQMDVRTKRCSRCVSNEFTGFLDAWSTRSFLLLVFLGAERQQKLRFSENMYLWL